MSCLDSAPIAAAFSLHRYQALNKTQIGEPLVLLHGWGTDSRCWDSIVSDLQLSADVIAVDYLEALKSSLTLIDFFDALLGVLPQKFAVMGWSLGGMLATRLADHDPERACRLITLASNLRFTVGDDWGQAMDSAVFQDFLSGFERAPEKTMTRFAGLMSSGDSNARGLLKPLRAQAANALHCYSLEALRGGLGQLGLIDNRDVYPALKVPGLHIFGDGDVLVPVSAAREIAAMSGREQKVEVIAGASHALISAATQQVMALVSDFLSPSDNDDFDKRRVAASFGRAAETYDSVAGLQRQIGHVLLNGMPDKVSGRCMDLGCGTGHFIPQLQKKGLDVLGVDLAEGMLNFARQRNDADWLCADAEKLPLADQSLDLVFSSLAIQWCHNLPALFGGLKRTVRPGGQLHLATLGPGTLKELRSSWESVDGYVHVNRFIDRDSLEGSISEAGLRVKSWATQEIVLQYDALRELTYELKALGAHNVNAGQSSGLTGRARIKKLRDSYDAFRMANGKLPATYEVFYLVLEA